MPNGRSAVQQEQVRRSGCVMGLRGSSCLMEERDKFNEKSKEHHDIRVEFYDKEDANNSTPTKSQHLLKGVHNERIKTNGIESSRKASNCNSSKKKCWSANKRNELAATSSSRKRSKTPANNVYSSDEDDATDECGSGKPRKFYMVTNGNRPSELFRTDLNHFKRDDDSSSDEDAPSMKITDRWKEGWTHVQVPIAEKWPEFIVNNEPSSSSSVEPRRIPFQSTNKRIAVHDARYVDDQFSRVTMRPLISYQCDRLDQIYLNNLNVRRNSMGLPPIELIVFAEIIDRFEVKTYKAIHHDLLAPLTCPTPMQAELDEDAYCDICRQTDYEDDDEIIFCDGCNLGVHQSCYGLDSVPKDEWLCNACTLLGYKAQPRCVLCPLLGGALKCMKGGETWAHVVCALWIPEVRFGDVDHREPINNVSDVPSERWTLKCSVCDTKQGACIQCSVKSCTTAFHVTCALRNEQEMRIEHDSTMDDGVRMVSLCGKHTQEMHGHDDHEATRRGASPRRAVKYAKPREELRRMEEMFFLYVSPEEISKDTGVDLEIVDDVYEYWKMKRIENGNKTLLEDVNEVDFLITSEQEFSYHGNSSVLSMRVQNETKMRQNLEKARNLCYMTTKREKHKRESIGYLMDAYKLVKSALDSTEVPLSSRTLDRYCEALSAFDSLTALDIPSLPHSQQSSPVIIASVDRQKFCSSKTETQHTSKSQKVDKMILTRQCVAPNAFKQIHTISSTCPERTLKRTASSHSEKRVSSPPSASSESQNFSSKFLSSHRKASEGESNESAKRSNTFLERNRCILPLSNMSPSSANDSKSSVLKLNANKIRERNGPDSPRRLPSQRVSAIKANISLDLSAQFPHLSVRSLFN
ncbi:unnamed protein product [Anisakis simplex]|uniref:PHD-type domain-containing protein n=1 Tax=Anisakis simplex TaxID=6269 RepID=A0A0M3K7N2_ANISI|nr:unnamed protein product [Anisakis simplex]